MTADPEALRDAAIAACKAAGFHRMGIVPLAPSARADVYGAWLAAGHHGEMSYLATPEHGAGRADATTLLPGARTAIVVALAYGADAPPAAPPTDGPVALRGAIARYARGTDYHLIVRDRLQAVAAALVALAGPLAWRVCVDAAPLAERELAERAGLGFTAKNTMVIAPGLGSYVVLGELDELANTATSWAYRSDALVSIALTVQDKGGEHSARGATLFERLLEFNVPAATKAVLKLHRRTPNTQSWPPARRRRFRR